MLAIRAFRSSRLFVLLVIVAGLAVSGSVLNRVAAPAWTAARARQPALRLDSSFAAAGQGVTLALLGGFRALVADIAWLRMYVIWEKQDLAGTETLIRFVTAVDPRPVYFWLNGARILAYDLPFWRIAAAGGYDVVSKDVQQRISREQSALALKYLEAGMSFHPTNADLWVERANIELNRMGDLAAAAESYRRASELPDAPLYAARLHAEMLRRMGRKADALAFLIRLHPSHPVDEDGRDIVLERIRSLERELGVPASEAYRSPR